MCRSFLYDTYKSALSDRNTPIIKIKKKTYGVLKGVQSMDYRIMYVNGHIEVYDGQGEFLFSADTEQEAQSDLRELCA